MRVPTPILLVLFIYDYFSMQFIDQWKHNAQSCIRTIFVWILYLMLCTDIQYYTQYICIDVDTQYL